MYLTKTTDYAVMAGTFTQLYTHIVFAVRDYKPFINCEREAEIFGILDEIISCNGHKTLIVDGTPNHVHILIKQNPAHAIADLVREVKRQSSYYINRHLLKDSSFHWQEGYVAFSHTRSQVNTVYKYIEKQKEYHLNRNFKEEYLEMASRVEEPDDEMIFKHKYQ